MNQPNATDPLLLLTVDGQTLEALPEETILACARRHGLYIPSLCELNDIDHAPGTCRVCLVEVASQNQTDEPLLAAACVTPARAGMNVRTRSRRAREAQRLQVELLMADHNQDCATCVRHGNCELQDVAQFVGLHTNRFYDRARVMGRTVDRSSPAMVRDMTKCVRCQRCIAICRQGQTVDALVVTGNGLDTAVGLRHGLSQAESTCVTCGQCLLVCPTGALGERDETDRVLDYLFDPEIVTVFQFAPAVRVGFGEEFGFPVGTNVEGHIIAALRSLGADIVLDTNFAADVVIMEESAELLRRLGDGRRPTFTSCCPAWINFAERHYPDLLPLLSSTKSPQQCLGAIAKTYLPERMGIDPARIRVISIMPCVAKKDERARSQLGAGDVQEVDLVLTTREFARLLKRRGLDLRSLTPSTFDNPYMSAYSGAGAIFGTTGGVMEAAVRTMYRIVNGHELDHTEVAPLRGFEGLRTAAVEVGGPIGRVKVAMAHGLGPARELCERIRAGTADFDFIEIMACPGGCVDGGGNLRSKKAYRRNALKRRDTLFAIDRATPVRQSHNNPQVQALYRDYLEQPFSERAHRLLHTWYSDRRVAMTLTVKDIWNEITMSTTIY
ncbi:[FeFe] hydrogenase, group A [Thiobaca trueperi]|uniref:Ferredoxin hydrogenase gamma subunit n=1 Tax=Thiobaca trueperi TaxID=127458 RepID=A0A4R3MX96_9GAMM|nr:[FeFe] hydrogenase, group A [Thiobaca trueperi]TCT18959.1 ferredoxin hydrogenase gamma subunit [Thiobaca trueperi]